jgi:hypothetical protein
MIVKEQLEDKQLDKEIERRVLSKKIARRLPPL